MSSKDLICHYRRVDTLRTGQRRYRYNHDWRVVGDAERVSPFKPGEYLGSIGLPIWVGKVTWYLWRGWVRIAGTNLTVFGVSFDPDTRPCYWICRSVGMSARGTAAKVWIDPNQDFYLPADNDEWARHVTIAGATRKISAPNWVNVNLQRINYPAVHKVALPIDAVMMPAAVGERVLTADGSFGVTDGLQNEDMDLYRVAMDNGEVLGLRYHSIIPMRHLREAPVSRLPQYVVDDLLAHALT